MEEDLLNKALRQHAERYTVNPEYASFDEVMQRMAAKKRRKMALWVSTAATVLVGAWVAIMLTGSDETQPVALTHSTSQQQITTPTSGQQKDRESNTPQTAIPATAKVVQQQMQQQLASQTPGSEQATRKPVNARQKNISQSQEPVVAIRTREEKATEPVVFIPPTDVQESVTEKTIEPTGAVVAAIPPDSVTQQVEEVNKTKPVAEGVKPVLPDSTTPKEPAAKPEKKRNWSIAASFTPHLISNAYAANTEADLMWFNSKFDSSSRQDRAQFSYVTGLRLQRNIGKHMGVSSGLLISRIDFQQLQFVRNNKTDTTLKNTVTGGGQEKFDRNQQFDSNRYDVAFTYLEIPLMAHYRINKNKWSYQANAGVAYTYLVGTQSLVFNTTDTIKAQEVNDAGNSRFQRHSLLVTGGFTVARQLHKRWSIYAGPVARYGLWSSYNKGYTNRQKPFFAGVEAGVKFLF